MEGGCPTWHCGGVSGSCGKSLRIGLHAEDGLAEDSGGNDIQSELGFSRFRWGAGDGLPWSCSMVFFGGLGLYGLCNGFI
jgi:hypothetical protein